MRKICLIIPCYNEEGNPSLVNDKLQSLFATLEKYCFEILFVNDGSKDNTLQEIKRLSSAHKNVHYISLSRNFGHQSAIKAGIDYSHADAVITMDADLQHPPQLITEMIKIWENGNDVVNTKRLDSEKQSWFKKTSSNAFYRIINLFSYVKIETGTADFRLMDAKVVRELKNWNEQNLFFRGIIPWLGFRQYAIEYQPEERSIGETKYTIRKMFSFALSGLTSFSIKPLRLSIVTGIILSLIAVFYMLYAVYISLFTDYAIQGWASIVVSVIFIGGIQLLMLGIIGEYLGKLFIENKKRPNYIIDETSIENKN